MTCSECHTEYCYLCGGFYLGGLHFAPLNLVGCPGMKNDQDRPVNSRAGWLFFLFRWIICLPLMLALVGLVLGVGLAILAVWLPTVIALAPIWLLAFGVVRCQSWRSPHANSYRNYGSSTYRWNERLKIGVFWGPACVYGLVRCIFN